jgi:hypothetical protein
MPTPIRASPHSPAGRSDHGGRPRPDRAGGATGVPPSLVRRHVGPLDTPLGRLPASGARIDLRVIDILRLTDGRISAIWMVGDWLAALAAAGLVPVGASEG